MKLSKKHLKTVCNPVPEGHDIRAIVDAMWETMCTGKGIGLAANQVGQASRIIVVHAGGFRKEFINPVITKKYGGTHIATEGCLSYPRMQVRVRRHKRIMVEGFDRDWNPIKFRLGGLAARCVQHEVDHLNAKTIC